MIDRHKNRWQKRCKFYSMYRNIFTKHVPTETKEVRDWRISRRRYIKNVAFFRRITNTDCSVLKLLSARVKFPLKYYPPTFT